MSVGEMVALASPAERERVILAVMAARHEARGPVEQVFDDIAREWRRRQP